MNLILFLLTVTVRDTIIEKVFFYRDTDAFMDFYNSIYDVSMRDPYTHGVIYPPLSCLILYLFSRFIPLSVFQAGWYKIEGGDLLLEHFGAQLALLVFLFVPILFFLFFVLNLFKRRLSLGESMFLAVAFLFSAPVLFQAERGNIIFIAIILTLIFFLFYDSEKPIIAELALVSLAAAAAIKIYPVVLGLLLLKERKYKAALRCVLYSLVLFIGPVFLFGGIGSLKLLAQNISSTSSDAVFNVGIDYKINYANTWNALAKMFQMPALNETGVIILTVISGLILLSAAWIAREKWQSAALLCLILIGLPVFSYIYTLIFLIIPLVFLFQKDQWRKIDWVYLVLFILLMIPIPYGKPNFLTADPVTKHYNLQTLVESLSLILLSMLLIIEIFFSRIRPEKVGISK